MTAVTKLIPPWLYLFATPTVVVYAGTIGSSLYYWGFMFRFNFTTRKSNTGHEASLHLFSTWDEK